MTGKQGKSGRVDVKALLSEKNDYLRALLLQALYGLHWWLSATDCVSRATNGARLEIEPTFTDGDEAMLTAVRKRFSATC